MWEMDYKESWVPKNWYFWTVVLEKTLESPLNCKEIQPVHPKGNRSWMFIGRTDVEAEIPMLWPPDTKNWLTGKDPDSGKDWRQEEKGMTEDEMFGWHHWPNGHVSDELWEIVEDREAWRTASMGSQRVRQDWVTEQQQKYILENVIWNLNLKFFTKISWTYFHGKKMYKFTPFNSYII